MKRSSDRILTTHVGSLPRPDDLRAMILEKQQGAAIDDAYFTNGVPPEDEEHFGIAADRPWPTPPSDSFFYENARANRLYARGDESSTSPDSAHVFQNRQIFRLNGKQNLWGGVVLRHSARVGT